MSWYAKIRNKLATGQINLLTDDIRALIVTDAYVQSDAHEFVADVAAQEVAGSSRSGTLANRALTDDDANDRSAFTHDATAHGSPAAGPNIQGAILFKHTGNDATAELLLYDPDTSAKAANGQPVTYQPPATGHYIENPD